jgi:hypothetical protein
MQADQKLCKAHLALLPVLVASARASCATLSLLYHHATLALAAHHATLTHHATHHA